jgi:hypothetical protein
MGFIETMLQATSNPMGDLPGYSSDDPPKQKTARK